MQCLIWRIEKKNLWKNKWTERFECFKATACQRSLLIASPYPSDIPCPSFEIFIPGWFFAMLRCGPGDYFSSIIHISIIYFNYQVLEQENLIQFSF